MGPLGEVIWILCIELMFQIKIEIKSSIRNRSKENNHNTRKANKIQIYATLIATPKTHIHRKIVNNEQGIAR